LFIVSIKLTAMI